MSWGEIALYQDMLPALEAEEAMLGCTVVAMGTASLKEMDQRMIMAKWRAVADFESEDRRDSDLDAAQLAQLGIGVEVEK